MSSIPAIKLQLRDCQKELYMTKQENDKLKAQIEVKDKQLQKLEQYNDSIYDKIVKFLKTNTMPDDFEEWSISNLRGWTIAHEAARINKLPDDFNQWDLMAPENNWSVAHVAAKHGTLPTNFEQWEICDKFGLTVAHIAAANGNLPDDFNQWDLKTYSGLSVQDVLREYRRLLKK